MLTGRGKEIQYLQKFYEKSGSRFVVLYGQRGVGKTRLVREFTEEIPCFYYACREVSEREQRCQWGKELSENGADMEEFPAWQELFEGSLQDSSEKQAVVLDEFQYLVKNSGEFMEELVSFVERCADKRELLIILISSSTSWVESSMIKKMGRAAYKLSGVLKIKPLGFLNCGRLFRIILQGRLSVCMPCWAEIRGCGSVCRRQKA